MGSLGFTGRAPAVEGAFEAVPRKLARVRLARGT
jgi:hypothetical protein